MTTPPTKTARKTLPGKSSANPLRHLRTSDIRGVAKLATETTIAINRMSEGVHQSVLGTLGISRGGVPGKTRGITGLVYKSIYGVTQLVANSIDKALLLLQPLFERVEEEMPGTSEREAVLAILNGVMGDRLVATGNPLATPMTLRYRDKALDSSSITPTPNPTSKVVVLVHGLCLSDLQWRFVKHDEGQEHAQSVDLGETLATELGYTPVYVRYNTGLHTSQNGRELANQLEQMVAHWPAPIEELTLIGYSMGGLVARSACHYGKKSAMRWHGHLQNIVFLATPHHGAPLERAGNWLDAILGSTPYSAPYAKLLQLRSAGITDLRYGHVLDEDWQGHDRFRRKPDSRQLVPLPAGVNCYTVAATTASRRSALADRWIGDGLVPLHSALGQHDDARRVLGFAKSAQWIGYNTNHMDVPGRPEVMRKVLEWLTPAVSE